MGRSAMCVIYRLLLFAILLWFVPTNSFAIVEWSRHSVVSHNLICCSVFQHLVCVMAAHFPLSLSPYRFDNFVAVTLIFLPLNAYFCYAFAGYAPAVAVSVFFYHSWYFCEDDVCRSMRFCLQAFPPGSAFANLSSEGFSSARYSWSVWKAR